MFTIYRRTEEIRPLLGTHTHSEEGQGGNENLRQGNCPRSRGFMALLNRTEEAQKQKPRVTALQVSKTAVNKFSNNACAQFYNSRYF